MKAKKNSKKPTSVRLTSCVNPEHYHLTLKPDLEAFKFDGKEVVTLFITQPINEITLHSKDLDIETAEVTYGDISQFANKISYNEKSETATFKFKNKIPKGTIKLSLVFTGMISESLRGFYRSRYTLNGETKHLATTQFEATDARRAFPCFDEPAQKAVFDVSLIIPGTHTAISNTLPTKIAEHEGGYKVIDFASTPRMSTYLLAFIIGEFEFIEGYTKDKVQIRVFTTAGKKHQAKFALDVAIKSLEFYNDYFGIAYPLPILDLIALPDFESAAMENWGAVTFRETALLVDDEHTSFANKQWVAIVIAHELAHQWFGNLVTMHWWTDLWLNEGFASYMEYLAVDHIFPEWKVWDLYLTERYSLSLRLDSLENSHPIEVEVHHPDEISEIFDMVSYAKGSAVIRMLAEYLGKDKFQKGLKHYMKKHSYKNTKTMDLWKSFEEVSGKPVRKIMKNWTSTTGYPLLSTKCDGSKCTIEQERFFSSRVSAKKNKEKTIWNVPFKYDASGKTISAVLDKKRDTLKGKKIGKVNKNESSPIRVRYDSKTLENIKEEIRQGKMNSHDRLGVIRDLFALAEGGYIDTVQALDFALVFKDEKEYIVWAEIASGIDRVYNIISEEEFVEIYKEYALTLFSPLAESMGWTKIRNEDNAHTFLRNLALSHAGMYGDKKVISHAQDLWKNRKYKTIDADIRSVVYTIIAKNGSAKEWEEFAELYKNEELHEEKERYGRALTAFKDKTLLARTLTFSMSSFVRTQDAPFMIGSVWQNTAGRDLAWKFVQHNWDKLLKRYGEGGHFLGRVISPLGSHTKESDAKDVKKFFKTHNAPGAKRTIEQSLERIHSNASWLKADKEKIKNWLNKKPDATIKTATSGQTG